jgi:hypothetical protein
MTLPEMRRAKTNNLTAGRMESNGSARGAQIDGLKNAG